MPEQPDKDWSGDTVIDGPVRQSAVDWGALGARAEAATRPLPATPGQPVGEAVARYAVRGALGSGGMGDVLQVLDPDIGRLVAAKVVRGGTLDEGQLQRFVLEAQVTGQLAHPGIVPLYELGVDDGRPYYTMKQISGRDLSDVVDELRAGKPGPGLAERLAIFSKVCDALGYAHSRGVIHRDLKPANVMVGAFGEVLVVDWGLAKILDTDDVVADAVSPNLELAGSEGPLVTMDGTICGTPAYMPPEQADGQIKALDARSDVYSLGAILFELLCYEPPFSGGSSWEVLAKIADGLEAPPSALAPADAQVPRELEAIVLKAMSVRPRDRYRSAAALKADIERYLGQEPVSAADYSALQRGALWVKRRPTTALAVAMLSIFGALAGLGLGAYQAQLSRAAMARAETARVTREAQLKTLAQEDKLGKLMGELGVTVRQQRDQAMTAFAARWDELSATAIDQDALDRALSDASLREHRYAFEQWFSKKERYPELVEITAADHFYRGVLQRLLKEHERAIWSLGEALAAGADRSATLTERALARVAGNDRPGALADAAAAVAAAPTDRSRALIVHAQLLMAGGQRDAAREALDLAVQRTPTLGVAWRRRGLLRRRQRDHAGALSDLRKAHELDARDPVTMTALASALLVGGAKGQAADQARELLDRSLALSPSLEAYVARGNYALARGLGAQALADLTTAITMAPHVAGHYLQRGKVLELHYRALPRATEDYTHAITLATNQGAHKLLIAEAHVRRGSVLGWNGRYDQAFADLDVASQLAPSWEEPLLRRAAFRLRRRRPDLAAALADADGAIQRAEANGKPSRGRLAEALVVRGHALALMRRPADALVAIERSIAIHRTADGYYWRGLLSRLDPAKAEADYFRAIQIEFGHWRTLEMLASLRFQRKRYETALAYVDRALQYCPKWEPSRRGLLALQRSIQRAFDAARKERK